MKLSYNINKLLIYIKAMFLKDAKSRKPYRKQMLEALVEQTKLKMKWGVSYSVFDGEELLEASIRSIRNSVDYVNVVYQLKSWYGEPASKNLYLLLQKLKANGLIDEIIEYCPNTKLNAGIQEKIKRNMGLKAALNAKVDYFMTMDTDEFYFSEELEQAKNDIISKNVDYSYCPIVNYGMAPTERSLTPTSTSVPFFSKINYFSRLGKNKNIICLADPTRQFKFIFGKQYFLSGINMHHMSFVRENMQKKFNSSSNMNMRENISKNIEHLKKLKTVSVENNFNIFIGKKDAK